MLPDPVPGRLPAFVPGPLPLGPSSRYAGMSVAELAGWFRRLTTAAEVWAAERRRLSRARVTGTLGGPCARALDEAHQVLLGELSALSNELEARLAEVRSAVAG